MSEHLKTLEEDRVFSIEKREDGIWQIWEACDGYFSVQLTSDELKELGAEIIALSEK